MAFFSGYPLIYTITLFIAGSLKLKNDFSSKVVSLLPFAYALIGTLFLGFELKKLHPDFSIENIKLVIQQPYLIIWGLFSILFWIPAIGKRKGLSLIHSLVFVWFLVRDLFLQVTVSSADNNIIRNDIKIYINSILLNLVALAVVVLISFLFTYYKKRLRS